MRVEVKPLCGSKMSDGSDNQTSDRISVLAAVGILMTLPHNVISSGVCMPHDSVRKIATASRSREISQINDYDGVFKKELRSSRRMDWRRSRCYYLTSDV